MRLAILLGLVLPFGLLAQDTLVYEDCLEQAVENSPRLLDKEIIDDQGRLIQENLANNWLPDMTVNGKFSYQSDVVSLDFDIPGMSLTLPEMPHSQYALNLDVRQTIYDGGMTKRRKQYEASTTALQIQQVDVDIHALKSSITEIYFSALQLQENRNTLEIILDNLKSREKVMESALRNGILEEADLQLIQVEILKILQSLSEIDAKKLGLLQMLSIYTGEEHSSDTYLSTPYMEMIDNEGFNRPEFHVLDMQAEVLEAGKLLHSASRLPIVYAFGQAGFGMPGYNMLNDAFDTYYMVGAGLQWKIWDWNKSKREKQILEKKRDVLENTRSNLSMNLEAQLLNQTEQMEHLENALSLDDKMLKIRLDITKNANSKLDNGVISATDYLIILNEESSTRIRKTSHKLQLLHALTSYNMIKGNL
jgi:outer membrane protein TolC